MEQFALAMEQKAPVLQLRAARAERFARTAERRASVVERGPRAMELFAAVVEHDAASLERVAPLEKLGASTRPFLARHRSRGTLAHRGR
jgi:hypothetical protein